MGQIIDLSHDLKPNGLMLDESADRSKKLFASLGIRLHCLLAWCPVSRTDLIRVGLHVLECLKHTQSLVNIPADRQVVDCGVHDHTLRVDNEQSTQGYAFCVVENVVSSGDFLLQVRNQRIVDIADAALISCCLNPG